MCVCVCKLRLMVFMPRLSPLEGHTPAQGTGVGCRHDQMHPYDMKSRNSTELLCSTTAFCLLSGASTRPGQAVDHCSRYQYIRQDRHEQCELVLRFCLVFWRDAAAHHSHPVWLQEASSENAHNASCTWRIWSLAG